MVLNTLILYPWSLGQNVRQESYSVSILLKLGFRCACLASFRKKCGADMTDIRNRDHDLNPGSNKQSQRRVEELTASLRVSSDAVQYFASALGGGFLIIKQPKPSTFLSYVLRSSTRTTFLQVSDHIVYYTHVVFERNSFR